LIGKEEKYVTSSITKKSDSTPTNKYFIHLIIAEPLLQNSKQDNQTQKSPRKIITPLLRKPSPVAEDQLWALRR
jgi:hypothetical protein